MLPRTVTILNQIKTLENFFEYKLTLMFVVKWVILTSTNLSRFSRTRANLQRFTETHADSHKLVYILAQSHTDSHNLTQTPAILCRFPQTSTNSYRFEKARTDLWILKKAEQSKAKKLSKVKKANIRFGIYRKSLCGPKQLDFQGRLAAGNFSTII